MFSTRKFRDEVAQLATGLTTTSFSASGSLAGSLIDVSLHQRIIFRMFAAGAGLYGNATLTLQSTANSANSWTSAASNWATLSSDAAVTLTAAAASDSTKTYVAALDVRGDRFPGTQYIRPVLTVGAGVASNSVARPVVIADSYLTAYGPASDYDSAKVETIETDFI